MHRPSLQILLCTHSRPPDHSVGCCCHSAGAPHLLEVFRQSLRRRGVRRGVWITRTSCIMNCSRGPIVVVYPAGDWYSAVTPEQVEQILDRYLGGG
jgi:(2Fe-2S) ferredoxin